MKVYVCALYESDKIARLILESFPEWTVVTAKGKIEKNRSHLFLRKVYSIVRRIKLLLNLEKEVIDTKKVDYFILSATAIFNGKIKEENLLKDKGKENSEVIRIASTPSLFKNALQWKFDTPEKRSIFDSAEEIKIFFNSKNKKTG